MNCPFRALFGKTEPPTGGGNPAQCPFLSKRGASGAEAQELSRPAEVGENSPEKSDANTPGLCVVQRCCIYGFLDAIESCKLLLRMRGCMGWMCVIMVIDAHSVDH